MLYIVMVRKVLELRIGKLLASPPALPRREGAGASTIITNYLFTFDNVQLMINDND